MTIFIITRLLDMVTTLLNVNNYGWDIEGNPLVRSIGEKGLFIPYELAILIITIIAINRFKYKDIVYLVFSGISMVAVIINLYCFFFI